MISGKRIKLRWASYEEKLIKKTEAKAEARLIGLFKQGYTVEEVEKLLAQERAKVAADASMDMPQ